MATYYVSNAGNNSNSGTIGSPWATWAYGFSKLVAGDTLYIRGGTYRTTGTNATGSHISFSSKNGTSANPIRVWNYPGETPVFNLDNISPSGSWHSGLVISSCSYLHIKGLRITGLPQTKTPQVISASYISNLTDSTIENCTFDNCGGYGVQMEGNTEDVLFKNCDAHHNGDPYNAYENGNGFNITGEVPVDNITFESCRAWKNGDDGFDFLRWDGYCEMINCWAFWNGYDDSFNILGDGQGYKLGPGVVHQPSVLKRVLVNCIAAKNHGSGFDQNPWTETGIHHHYHNLSYDNGWLGFSYNDIAGIANIFQNNISYANDNANGYWSAGNVHDHNTWDSAVTVTNADFQSLVVSQLEGARKSDGSLPDITFGTLAAGSDLIGAGVAVTGLSYDSKGSAWTNPPSMGPFEYTVGSILVTGITVSGAGGATTISTNNGTLQMSAAILPSNATNQTVTWTVTAGSGTASKSGEGLL